MSDPRERRRYVDGMTRAISVACCNGGSRTCGLRVIRRFEKVNGITFDPSNYRHLEMIRGNAEYEEFFRRMHAVFRKMGLPPLTVEGRHDRSS